MILMSLVMQVGLLRTHSVLDDSFVGEPLAEIAVCDDHNYTIMIDESSMTSMINDDFSKFFKCICWLYDLG